MKHARTAALAALIGIQAAAFAWVDHDELTYIALGGESYSKESVSAEELPAFLEATKDALAKTLREIEARAEREIPDYPRLPGPLAFDPSLSGKALLDSFIAAIRVNPDVPLPLFVQLERNAPHGDRPDLPVSAVDIFAGSLMSAPFEALAPGEAVTALEVLASASDEPDYGLDIGLYENNGKEAGRRYGFGEQPFGNPALIYGSQAPFHMSFPAEDPIVKAAAAFTQKGLTEYRVLQYTELARFAFRSGHRYWGYRFAGWAAHYVQDMTQPYHASVMPERPAFAMLALYILGSKADVDGAVVLLSNRHLMIEDYLYRVVERYRGDAKASPVYAALAGEGAPTYSWRDFFASDVAAWNAFGRGNRLDELIVATFPAKYVNDPSYDYGASENAGKYDPYAELEGNAGRRAAIETLAAEIFRDTGASTRSLVSWTLAPDAKPAPRQRPFDLRVVALAAVPLAIVGLVIFLVVISVKRRRAK